MDKKEAKTSAVHRAVNSVKSTPKKIIEHTVNTALDTMEKAVQTEIKRTNKRVAKTTKKLQKAQSLAKAAKTEAKRASALSSSLDKINHGIEESSSLKKVSAVKDKIKEMIAPQKETFFYYDRRQLFALTVIYALLAIFVYAISNCLYTYNMFNSWPLLIILIITQVLCLAALASILFVTIIPQTLAITNKDGIKIDHNELLSWHDIELAEEKYTSYLTRRPFMALHVKKATLAKYHLTFMQKLCKANIFTPFSIPLYAMRPEDVAEIRNIIKKHVKYQDNRN